MDLEVDKSERSDLILANRHDCRLSIRIIKTANSSSTSIGRDYGDCWYLFRHESISVDSPFIEVNMVNSYFKKVEGIPPNFFRFTIIQRLT
jgi:hypothetical protein